MKGWLLMALLLFAAPAVWGDGDTPYVHEIEMSATALLALRAAFTTASLSPTTAGSTAVRLPVPP